MAKKYMFGIDENGKAMMGTVLEYPDEYTTEGTEEVWENQERAFYDEQTGTWTVYDRLTVSGPNSAMIGETITVTATLPENSPDDEVTFQVRFEDELSDQVTVTAIDGVAEQQFSFDTEGVYTIIMSSVHHGSASLGVTVSEQPEYQE